MAEGQTKSEKNYKSPEMEAEPEDDKADTKQVSGNERASSKEKKEDEEVKWFAMSAYRREKESRKELSEAGIESFLPMRYELRQQKSKKQRKLVPAIPSMIFVRATKTRLLHFKQTHPRLRFMTFPYEGKNEIITVPDREMERFIKVASQYEKDLVYYKVGEVSLKKGVKVKVHGTAFDGLEGYVVKTKGKKKKRVFVRIQSLALVATSEIEPEYISIIPEEDKGED